MVTTYDRSRVVSKEARVHRDAMARLDRALELHLGLTPP